MNPLLLKILRCSVCKSELTLEGNKLYCHHAHEYPVVDDIPVMLIDSNDQTMDLVHNSIRRSKGEFIDEREPSLYLESLGISAEEKNRAVELFRQKSEIDPVVSVIIGATSGYLYKDIIGKVTEYPLPDIRLPAAQNKLLLDVGCNWGRWSIAAAKKGYHVIGIDPSLGGIMAARRVARQLNVNISYVCGDARYLPFQDNVFDVVFSYSVLQHLSKENAKEALKEISRTLTSGGGYSFIQMPGKFGIRSFYHQARRRFRKPVGFEVRYWSPKELLKTFNHMIGESRLEVDGFFGLGIQKSDSRLLPFKSKVIINSAELLRNGSKVIYPLTYLADSIYIKSYKN